MTGSVGGAPGSAYVANVTYAAHGALQQMQYGSSGGGRYERQCYNERLQVTGLVLAGSAVGDCATATSYLMKLDLGWGASGSNNGNLQSQVVGMNNAGWTAGQTYGYDKLNRLEWAQEGAAWKQTFGYDRWGNRWVETAPAQTYGVLTDGVANGASWFTAKNRLNNLAHDDAGNLLRQAPFTMSYDGENRVLTTLRDADVAGEQRREYGYDGEGRRVKQVVGSGSKTLTTYYVYDAMGQLAAEYEKAVGGAVSTPSHCATCFLFTDHLGSTRAVWDASGLKARYDHLPFGEAVLGSAGNRASANCGAGPCYEGPGSLKVRFTGKERDAETGLDYFGARYLSAAQGRLSSPDTVNVTNARLISASSTLNKYIYGGNNPLKFVDPDGKDIVVFYSTGGTAGHWMMAAHNPTTNDFAFRSFGPTDHSLGTVAQQVSGVGVPGTEVYSLPTSVDDLRQNYAALTIQTSPEQAQAAINSIRESGGSTYTLYKYNCTTACQAALREAGITLSATTPKLAWEFLYVDYSKEALARKNSPLYQGWRARLLPSLLPSLSMAPAKHGVDYGSPRPGFDAFDFVMKMLLLPQRGCVTVQGAKGPETSCEP